MLEGENSKLKSCWRVVPVAPAHQRRGIAAWRQYLARQGTKIATLDRALAYATPDRNPAKNRLGFVRLMPRLTEPSQKSVGFCGVVQKLIFVGIRRLRARFGALA
jgi:hypothetical protein